MRIYNGTNSFLCLPYVGDQRVNVSEHSVSGDIGANTEFISRIITSYNVEEVAFIVSGPYELNLFSTIPTATNYVVQSLDEAIERFAPKVEKKEEVVKEACDECECEAEDCECDCECGEDTCCPGTSNSNLMDTIGGRSSYGDRSDFSAGDMITTNEEKVDEVPCISSPTETAAPSQTMAQKMKRVTKRLDSKKH